MLVPQPLSHAEHCSQRGEEEEVAKGEKRRKLELAVADPPRRRGALPDDEEIHYWEDYYQELRHTMGLATMNNGGGGFGSGRVPAANFGSHPTPLGASICGGTSFATWTLLENHGPDDG